jgi:hypothetical protein
MLSAKSNGQLYISGNIQDPKSREYECTICPEKVSHVNGHRRSASEFVTEHFRHPKAASHPIRSMSKMKGDALEFILAQFDKKYEYEVLTDQIYSTPKGDLATDILLRQHGKKGFRDTIVNVEANPFNYQNDLALNRSLSKQGIFYLPVLCAKGDLNGNGKFFVNEYRRASDQMVIKLSKNEMGLYDRIDRSTYFDHDNKELFQVRFVDYEEEVQEDIVSRNRWGEEFIIKPAGSMQQFKLKKRTMIEGVYQDDFNLEHWKFGNGLLVARFKDEEVHDLIRREHVAMNRDDSDKVEFYSDLVCKQFDGFDEATLKELTERYGEDYMGGYSVL